MLVVRKRINGLNVRVHMSTSDYESRISGSVFPFGRQFHTVTFAATREVDLSSVEMKVSEATPEIGFSGNQHKGENAALMLKAGQVAFDQANYYANLNNSIAQGEHLAILRDLIDCGDQEGFLDALLLTPQRVSDDQTELQSVIRKIVEDASVLGLKGILTSDRLEELEQTNMLAHRGLMKLTAQLETYGAPDGSFEERVAATKSVIDQTVEKYIKGQ